MLFNTFHGAVNLPSLRISPIRRPVFGLLVCAFAFWMIAAAYGGADFDRLLVSLTQRWGGGAATKFTAWRAMVVGAATATDADRIKRANDFFNRQMQFGDDSAIWGQVDFWATPMESLGKGAGDCEDFAIAKYFTLKEMGVASEKLRLIYVRAKTGTSDVAQSQAHMVLAYYAQPDAEPLVLDNLIGEIRPASRRLDLVPVFSFNSEGVYTGTPGKEGAVSVGVGRLSRWEDLLKRARLEGFE
ncbi:MAG TPA: transglutaminase-like cysteine peptidase [Rhodoferax sp.]|nr:transglutaminase-like cysteine peptidase [Rhodoferax sp.]